MKNFNDLGAYQASPAEPADSQQVLAQVDSVISVTPFALRADFERNEFRSQTVDHSGLADV